MKYIIILLLISFNIQAKEVPDIIKRYKEVSRDCITGSSNKLGTWKSCVERDKIYIDLHKIGWCYGESVDSQYDYQKTWIPCSVQQGEGE